MPAIHQPGHAFIDVSRMARSNGWKPYAGKATTFKPATPAEYRVIAGKRVLVLMLGAVRQKTKPGG